MHFCLSCKVIIIQDLKIVIYKAIITFKTKTIVFSIPNKYKRKIKPEILHIDCTYRWKIEKVEYKEYN